jgi:hypothetical protein
MHTVALIVMLIGITLALLGWLFFRRPGVAFWSFPTIWRANEFLTPPGVALWIGGFVGIALFALAPRL